MATSDDDWQRHSTSMKLTGMDRQAGKPMFWEAAPPKSCQYTNDLSVGTADEISKIILRVINLIPGILT